MKDNSLPKRYARGWYVLGHKRDFVINTPKIIPCFGSRLSIKRKKDGVEAHFDGIFLPVCEQNNLVFAWYDHQGLKPEYEIPVVEECFNEKWSDWGMEQYLINNNCRELIDNMADRGHFGPVHGCPAIEFYNEAKGINYSQIMTGESEVLGGSLWSEAIYTGPAYMVTTMKTDVAKSRLLVSHLPINHTNFLIQFGCMVEKDPNSSEEENQEYVQGYIDANLLAFGQDVSIWHNKIYIENPIMCSGDGPLNKLRKWYSQFYVDREDIPKRLDMPKRQF